MKSKLLFLFLILFCANQILAQQTIQSTASGGSWTNPTTWVGGTIPGVNDFVVLNGEVSVPGQATCAGLTIAASGKLINSNTTTTMTVNGNLVNQGQIQRTGWLFYVNVSGNIQNFGVWDPHYTTLTGTGIQNISCGANNYLHSFTNISVQNPGLSIVALTPIYLSSPFLLNSANFNLQGHALHLLGNGRFENGNVTGTANIFFSNDAYLGNYNHNLTLTGDSIKLNNKARLGDIALNGTVVVEDSVTNLQTTTNVNISGNIVNKGKIQRTGWLFTLNISGDIYNYGEWIPHLTKLTGTNVQNISCGEGNYLNPFNNISILNASLQVKALTPIYLKSPFLLNGSSFNLQGNALHLHGNGRFENGNVFETNNIYFLNDAYLGNYNHNLTLTGDSIKLNNKARLGDIALNGTVVVEDSVTNLQTTTNVNISGNIVNKGKIQRTGWLFTLNISGDIYNYGEWIPHLTKLTGTNVQNISCGEGNYLNPFNNISILNASLQVNALTPLYLKSPFLLNESSFNLQENALHLHGNGRFENGSVTETANVFFENEAYLGSYNHNIRLVGDSIRLNNKSRLGDISMVGSVIVVDSVININTTTSFNLTGNLINRGKIQRTGWTFNLFISGDIHNYGIWEPHTTNFTGSSIQNIYLGEEKYLNSSTNQVVQDSNLVVFAHTPVYLSSPFLLGRATFNLQENPLIVRGNGRFQNGKVIETRDLFFRNNAQLGSYNHNLQIEGDSIRINNLGKFGDITLKGHLQIVDTMMNINTTSTVNLEGNIFNKGVIQRTGWTFNLNIDGDTYNEGEWKTHNTNLSGNLQNLGSWEVTNLTFYGNRHRTLKLIGGETGNILFRDSLNLTGVNTVPKLARVLSDPAGLTIVNPGASLELTNKTAPTELLNYGKVFWSHFVENNAVSTNFNFYKSTIRNRIGTAVNSYTMEVFEHSMPPGVTNSMEMYWRLLNSPRDYYDTLVNMTLTYNPSLLNDNLQDSLKLFVSTTGGLTWRRIVNGVTHSPAQNKFTINNAPSAGMFVLASSELGITEVLPALFSIDANSGGNYGQVSTLIHGQALRNDALVKLFNPLSGITVEADTVILLEDTGELLNALFSFTGQAPGIMNLIVELPGDTIMTLQQAFTLETVVPANPNIFLSGRQTVLINRWQTYTITYSNIGNVDAFAVPVWLTISERPGLEVDFVDFEIENSDYAYENGYGALVDTMAVYFVTDSAFSDFSGVRVYPLYIPHIPASSVSSVRFKIKTPVPVKIQVAMQSPLIMSVPGNLKNEQSELYPGMLNPEDIKPFNVAMAQCMIAILGEGVIDATTGAIPVVGCIVQIGKNAFRTYNSVQQNEKKSWGSWIKDWAVTFVDCGINLSGVGAVVKAVGVLAVNLSGYADAMAECKAKHNKEIDVNAVASIDPNEKVGPAGIGLNNYIGYPDMMSYTIFFENLPAATAPAQTVTVTDTLDLSKYDISTFRFGAIGFDTLVFQPNTPENHFTMYNDRRPAKDIILEMKGSLDVNSGIIEWCFTSLDPVSLELTEDPFGGFLPPNITSPEGEGFVEFSIRPRPNLTHNTVISNEAKIVFDVNAPIITNLYQNKLDLVPPTAVIDNHEFINDTTVLLSWNNASDDGSGIRDFVLFFAVNDGYYKPYLLSNNETSTLFYGKVDSTYSFYIMGTDKVGNVQPHATSPNLTIVFEAFGLDETGKINEVFVYPNPVENLLKVRANRNTGRDVKIEIIDLYGKIVMKHTSAGEMNEIDVSLLPSGIYFVRVNYKEVTGTYKIIKK
jgi:hypothetical protein